MVKTYAGRECDNCGDLYFPVSPSQRYCDFCSPEMRKQKAKEYVKSDSGKEKNKESSKRYRDSEKGQEARSDYLNSQAYEEYKARRDDEQTKPKKSLSEQWGIKES